MKVYEEAIVNRYYVGHKKALWPSSLLLSDHLLWGKLGTMS